MCTNQNFTLQQGGQNLKILQIWEILIGFGEQVVGENTKKRTKIIYILNLTKF